MPTHYPQSWQSGSYLGGVMGGGYNYWQQQQEEKERKEAEARARQTVVDPVSGREIYTGALREGAELGAAQLARGFQMDIMQEQRRGEVLSLLQGIMGPRETLAQQAMAAAQAGPQDLEEYGRLIFGAGADVANQQAIARQQQMAGALGGRGISAASPLAAGLAAQSELVRSGQVRGVERDVRIALIERNAAEKARLFTQALQAQAAQAQTAGAIAEATMMIPEYGYEAQQGLTELVMEREAAERARKAGKKAGQTSLIASAIGGLASIAGAII